MNANSIINMVLRMFVPKAINSRVNAGVNALGKKDSAGRATPQEHRGTPPGQNQSAQQGVKQARRAARMARRMNKF
ncbi:MAG: hypothetical protein OQK00_03325 [Rhodobacteraceae bacterium]|nr:hypothetical protein [Paracoccaceae bacterium]